MFVGNSSIRRALASAGAAAATVGAVVALSAAPALAANSGGTSITGSGSSLQGAAQTSWSSTFNGSPVLTGEHVAYTSTSSGAGLSEFGNNGGGIQASDSGNGSTLDGFIGTDDPATTSQISAAETASGTTEITLPVIQAPVAVILSLPANVTIGSTQKVQLTNQELQNIWSGNVAAAGGFNANTWGSLFTTLGVSFSGAGGNTEITLQARSSNSGTTFTFRGYLNEIGTLLGESDSANPYPLASVVDDSADGWAVSVTETNNSTGGNLVQDVAGTPGSIGYANLADAASASGSNTNGQEFADEPLSVTTAPIGGSASTSHQIVYAQVQDNGISSSPAYADPSAASSPTTYANVAAALGNVDTAGAINSGTTVSYPGASGIGAWTVPTAADGTWANTNGAEAGHVAAADDPDVAGHDSLHGAGKYGVVAATYDDAWGDYETTALEASTAYGSNAAATGNTTFDYLKSVIGTSGSQSAPNEYASLPTGILSDIRGTQLPAVNGGNDTK